MRGCSNWLTQGRAEPVQCRKPLDNDTPTMLLVDQTLHSLDLCTSCKAKLAKVLEPWLAIGEPVLTRNDGLVLRAIAMSGGEPFTLTEARQWLRENGYRVAATGRIAEDMLQVYKDHRLATNGAGN